RGMGPARPAGGRPGQPRSDAAAGAARSAPRARGRRAASGGPPARPHLQPRARPPAQHADRKRQGRRRARARRDRVAGGRAVEAAAAGVREMVAVPMAPQYSTLSVAKYGEAVEASRPSGMAVRFVRSWHEHPGLLEAFAEKVRAARAAGHWDRVLFTAHSLPLRLVAQGDPYPEEVAATARGVAERAGVTDYARAYQSAGRTPEPWLGPPLEEALATAAAEGARRVLAVPVGFVCD